MTFRKPSHSTVVAYLALFAALGGTAIAARDDHGAKELKQLVVREKRQVASPQSPQTNYQAVARCKRNEQLMAGGGGWVTAPADPSQTSTVRSTLAVQKTAKGPPKGYSVQGTNPAGFSNTLIAQALCLPR